MEFFDDSQHVLLNTVNLEDHHSFWKIHLGQDL